MPVFSVRRDPRRGLSYVAILVLALLAGATPAIRPAQAADAAPATQSSAQAPMTADQAQQVLGVLNDPHKREEFTRTLTAIARGLPQAAPVPARASAPAAAPAPAAGNADVALEPNSLGSDVMSELAGVRDVTLHQAREFIGLFSDLVFVGHWIHSELSSPQSRQTLFDAFGRAGLIFILALAAERGLAIALRRPLSAVTARAVEAERQLNRSAEQETAEAAMPAPETEAEQAVQDTRRQDVRKQVETLRIIRRIPYSLLHLLTKLLPVALFLGIGYAGAAFVGDDEVTELVTLTLTNAYVAARAMYLVVEMIMVPKSPTIRLCGASDRTARIVTRWWNVLVAVPSIVVCLSSLGALFHLAPRGTEALIRAIVLAEHVMIAVFIWRIRKPVAMAMQPPARFRGRSFWSFVGHLAHFWWLPAMVFDLALWLVWAMHVRGGYTWIWRTTILTIVVILLSRVLSLLAFGLQNRVFHVSDEFEARYPGLQARADYYYPYARRGLSILLVFATLVILLQAWGIPAVAFFLYGALGTQIMTALVSIIIAFTIAIAVWEIANAALQNQIARYETTEQASRAIRLRTVLPIIRTVLLSVIIIIVAVTTLSQIGLNVAPLLTGAGIMGAAIAFGSQSLVKDFITGFFMLVENAMQVGDWVTAGGISGTVEHLSIRTLRLRTTSGDVHIIPFSSVTSIANTSRDYNVVVVTFMLDLSEDPDRVAAILADVVAGMRADPQFAPMILTDFAFLGVEKADGDGAKLVGSFRTTAGNKWKVSREYYRRLGLRMVAEGVKFPSPTAISLLGNTGGAPLRIQMVTPPAAANSNTQPPTDAPPRVPGGVPHPDTSQ
ncbi:mechanosensitive ion channel domain-containing protein [Gluconacetobacter diazotrophicus]|uniref:Mechanosensitive ion channel n=1 Tax=Gluconacetobacter diazotrophicus TaxID=33996 RepID=A0A7W4I5M5_GLUDI|nr:mechanosensitive ion channel domain-containing protein [Gluconacetobacter diazotrophicus]MBB2156706.1 mechanosensitive ion channel [Gluconacetobacter diazotrophicus]TWB08538.1 small conductance mechanosensitive channel [Gluconacetobacter diazotrophicus]